MEQRDVIVRLVTEKYKLEDLASTEVKKLREENESLTSTCNYLSQQLQDTNNGREIAENILNKIREHHPDVNIDVFRDEVLAGVGNSEVVDDIPQE